MNLDKLRDKPKNFTVDELSDYISLGEEGLSCFEPAYLREKLFPDLVDQQRILLSSINSDPDTKDPDTLLYELELVKQLIALILNVLTAQSLKKAALMSSHNNNAEVPRKYGTFVSNDIPKFTIEDHFTANLLASFDKSIKLTELSLDDIKRIITMLEKALSEENEKKHLALMLLPSMHKISRGLEAVDQPSGPTNTRNHTLENISPTKTVVILPNFQKRARDGLSSEHTDIQE